MRENFTVIILGYKRLYSLQRLLYSLVLAGKSFDSSNPLSLIISFDKGSDENAISFCRNFFSKYFEIKIDVKAKHLGVDEHNLWAMQQAETYGSVAVLEDDIMVSPSLFYYTREALAYYSSDEQIAGISLYNYERNEACNYPFFKIQEGYDNYFYQKASSRGLIITAEQWLKFKAFKTINNEVDLPQQNLNWGDEVWEKKFNTYLIHEKKFWVYPHLSLTTNFGEHGTHVKKDIYRHAFQSQFQQGTKATYTFSSIERSNAVYDAYGEAIKISGYKTDEITSDVFGVRDLSKIKTKYIFTSRHCSQWTDSYALDLIPPELNILHNLRGNDLKVTEVKFVNERLMQRRQRLLKLHYYFYPDKGLLHLLRLKLLEIFNRIKK